MVRLFNPDVHSVRSAIRLLNPRAGLVDSGTLCDIMDRVKGEPSGLAEVRNVTVSWEDSHVRVYLSDDGLV